MTEQSRSPTLSASGGNHDDPRVLRASRVAASQGLTLRNSSIRGGVARRYDLIDPRYDEPAALDLKLSAVEAWLGIRGTMRQ